MLNGILLQFWFCPLLRWKNFVEKIQIVLQWSKRMIVCTTMAVQLLCVRSHWECSYETIIWNCWGKEELLCSGSKVDGCGLEDYLLFPRRHIEIFLFATISDWWPCSVFGTFSLKWRSFLHSICFLYNECVEFYLSTFMFCDVMELGYWALRVAPTKESSRRKTGGSHYYFAISCLGCWSPHHWLSWGTVNIQVITTVINLYSWEYINPSHCTYHYKRKRIKQTQVQEGSSLTVITVLITIIHCIRYGISLTWQTTTPWLSINLSNQ